MEGNNAKLQDINGIPLLKWYLPSKKGTDETNNTEEIKGIEEEEIETVRNEILPEASSMFCNNLPTETDQEISECNINSILQSIDDSSMHNFDDAESSMSYNLRDRSNRKNDSKQNIKTNSRASPSKERRGRKRKIPKETNSDKISPKPAKKSLFNELQTTYLNKTPLIKKIKLDLIEKELSLKKIQKTLLNWVNSECSPLERSEALSLLENVKSIQADLSLLRGKLKFEKLVENRNILKKGIDELTSLANKINKQLIDIIVECDIQHERLTEEINDINSIFPKIVSIHQSTSNEYNEKPQQNFNSISQNPSQQMSKDINENETEIIFSNNELQTIKQYEVPMESQTANSLILNCKQEKINVNVCGEKEQRKIRQRKNRKPERSIVKKTKNLLKSEFNQFVKSLAKLTLTSQNNVSPVEAVHSKNLTPSIKKFNQKGNCIVGENLTKDFSNNCETNNNSFNMEVTHSSKIIENLCKNSALSSYQNKRKKHENEMNENQILKTFNQESDFCEPLPLQDKSIENSKLHPSVDESIVTNISPFQNKKREENDTSQTSKQNSPSTENLNSLKKPTVPISANLNRNSYLPIRLKTVNMILHENSKPLILNKCNNLQNKQLKYSKCLIKMLPFKSQTNTIIKSKESEVISIKDLNNLKGKSNLKICQETPKISQNIVDKCEENYVKKYIGKESSEILPKTLETSSMNDEFKSINKASSELLSKTLETSSMNDEFKSINKASSEILSKTLETSSMNDKFRSINNKVSPAILPKTLDTSSMNDKSRSINNTDSMTSVHPNYQLSISQNDKNHNNKIVDNSKGATKCEDRLLGLFDSEVPINDDMDTASKQIDQVDHNTSLPYKDTKQYTSTIVKVKDQETQTVTFQDDSLKFEQNGMNIMSYSDEILKCIESIKTIRVKSENDFVPINDLTNLIAGDDFNW